MLLHFIESDAKLITAWIGAAIMAMLNKFGFAVQDYELWKIIALDILTGVSLLVAIGYTITRWARLIKTNKDKKVKKDNTD